MMTVNIGLLHSDAHSCVPAYINVNTQREVGGGEKEGSGKQLTLKNMLDPSATSQGCTPTSKNSQCLSFLGHRPFLWRWEQKSKWPWESSCRTETALQPLLDVQQRTSLSSGNSAIRAQVSKRESRNHLRLASLL